MKSEKKEASDPPNAQLVNKEKSLRERVSELSAPPAPTMLPAKTVVDNDEKKEANIYKVNQKFILADKYRPKALKDFICNRSEATRLQALVRLLYLFSYKFCYVPVLCSYRVLGQVWSTFERWTMDAGAIRGIWSRYI